MNLNYHKYKTFIFDCDGVIFDSNSMKIDAFRETLQEASPDKIDEFINNHKKTGGVSRYQKFLDFYTKTNPVLNINEKVKQALDDFGRLTIEKYQTCKKIEGITAFLEKLKKEQKLIHINSGSDENQLKETLKQRNMYHFFDEILGSPNTKFENITRLKNKNKLIYPAVFFGDAEMDFKTAKKFELDFVLVHGVSEWENGINFCKENDHFIIKDFKEI